MSEISRRVHIFSFFEMCEFDCVGEFLKLFAVQIIGFQKAGTFRILANRKHVHKYVHNLLEL